MVNNATQGREDQGKGTELFIIWARILRGILENVCRAGGETTVREDADLDLRRVEPWEGWEATRTKVRSGSRTGRGEERRADDGRRVGGH
jgi:hypothetical protein